MALERLCVAVLALQALGAARARPSELPSVAGTATPTEAPANLLNQTAVYALCPHPPASLATAQERLCLAMLALQALGPARARPSEAPQVHGTAAPTLAAEMTANLLDKDTIFSACTPPPTNLATAEELSGDWCDLEYLEKTESGIGPPRTCERLSFLPVGSDLGVVVTAVRDRQIVVRFNFTLSQIANQSWLSEQGRRRNNFFLGFAIGRRYLQFCGTSTARDAVPRVEDVDHHTLARCLLPGEEAPLATSERPNVLRCDLPQEK